MCGCFFFFKPRERARIHTHAHHTFIANQAITSGTQPTCVVNRGNDKAARGHGGMPVKLPLLRNRLRSRACSVQHKKKLGRRMKIRRHRPTAHHSTSQHKNRRAQRRLGRGSATHGETNCLTSIYIHQHRVLHEARVVKARRVHHIGAEILVVSARHWAAKTNSRERSAEPDWDGDDVSVLRNRINLPVVNSL